MWLHRYVYVASWFVQNDGLDVFLMEMATYEAPRSYCTAIPAAFVYRRNAVYHFSPLGSERRRSHRWDLRWSNREYSVP